ncbi:hypothetical protein Q5P01_023873 [Channa striata]|uniref:Integrin beta N-terminal domain-containing protein n=1 Tax=Channa striata TaxID=64152 RepID=A0AA88IV41_CHASR|nr:hypothetical protein Q5P01_023873 [Channa striata]
MRPGLFCGWVQLNSTASVSRREMGRWMVRLSVGLGLLAVLLTCCCAEENYCIASKAKTCSECLQVGKGCGYCSEEVKADKG